MKLLSHFRFFATPWTVACTRLLQAWDFLSKSTGVGCHFLLQGIFPTQGSNPGLPHCRRMLYRLSHSSKESKSFIGGQFSGSLSSLWPIILLCPPGWFVSGPFPGCAQPRRTDCVKDYCVSASSSWLKETERFFAKETGPCITWHLPLFLWTEHAGLSILSQGGFQHKGAWEERSKTHYGLALSSGFWSLRSRSVRVVSPCPKEGRK